ncbi:uncharacterized protein MYCFIDRAFT_216677 [Pseudocercospora fijiensis CIRAD86]|uniref:Uncharacterized protein n=1 Tax=Pseudocercospora fijiensis (strain CIRAD86) TaxID=383855 RepID=M2ZHA2_PSEFD|nr:uncharacterized protein MYCFIDRAFT_216677 [Pseudocercospora fijiensis CIRAD86]EME78519.1 hypothetical protein MYCFIDRAFT_216677 [Pseudocercospora fijiensis CIRAD86]
MKGKNAMITANGAQSVASPSKKRKQELDTTAASILIPKKLKVAAPTGGSSEDDITTAFAAPPTQFASTANISQPLQGQKRKASEEEDIAPQPKKGKLSGSAIKMPTKASSSTPAASKQPIVKKYVGGELVSTSLLKKGAKIGASLGKAPAKGSISVPTPPQPVPSKKGKPQKKAPLGPILAAAKHLISPPSRVVEQSCDLLHKIPLEIRDRIWELVVANEDNIKLLGKEADTGAVKLPRPALFRVCRQTRFEVWDTYHKTNSFETDSTNVANAFLKQVGVTHYTDENKDKHYPGLVLLKNLYITDPFKVKKDQVDLYIQENGPRGRSATRLPSFETDQTARSLRDVRRCMMAIKYALSRKGLRKDVVKMQMLVHDQNDVLSFVQTHIFESDRFIEIPAVWTWVTLEDVDAHQYRTLTADRRDIKFTAVQPPSNGALTTQA